MTRPVKISARAAREVRKAVEWWERNRPSAPGAIAIDFQEATRLLAAQPDIGTECPGTRVKAVRRIYLSRVRYFIYYRVDAGCLEILAFWHGSRDAQPPV